APASTLFSYTTLFRSPGGALDEGESEVEALVREFREESGLAVTPGACFARANQYVPNHASGPVNNLCAFYEVREGGPPGSIAERSEEHTSELQSREKL